MLGVELRQSRFQRRSQRRFQRRFRAGMLSANTGGLGMHLVLQLARFPIRVEARVLLDFASEVITVEELREGVRNRRRSLRRNTIAGSLEARPKDGAL